jgi:hypothetical protein
MSGVQVLRSVKLSGQADSPVLVGSGLVEPGYFETVGVPILQGRGFTLEDRPGGVPVALVNRTMADRLWPGRNPVGEHLWIDEQNRPIEVVGVTADTKLSRLDEPPRPLLYLAFTQGECLRMSLHVRAKGNPASLIGSAVREARMMEPDLPVEVGSVTEAVEDSLSWARALASLLALLSLLGLIVATIGVYGMTSYSMEQKRGEIGLRIALGARRVRIMALVLRDSVYTALIGAAIGALAAYAATRWSSGLLQVPPPTLTSFIACSVVLLSLSSLAVLTLVVRTCQIEPSVALKGF